MFAQDQIAGLPAMSALIVRPGRLLVALLVGCTFWCSSPTFADEAGSFQALRAHVTEDAASPGFLLDGQFSITLSSGAKEALQNGIPLIFELQVQLVRVHRWIWDSVKVDLKQARQIQYHDLSRSYVVKYINEGTQRNFRQLSDAMDAAGALENLLLANGLLIEDDADYKIRLRGSLDIESLPTPVRLIAYVSSAWDMSSEWHTWSLDR
jgi:hypothetical protein